MGLPRSERAGNTNNERRRQARQARTNANRTQPAKARGRLGRDVQSKIGQQLRAMYDDVVSEGVPDRFTEMLQQLDDKAQQDKEKGPNA